MEEKKLGLGSTVATGVGLIVATSCLLSLGVGASTVGIPFIIAMFVCCMLNLITAFSVSELNAMMPNLTGGLAQYSLAGVGPFLTIIVMVGGYLVCNTICGSAECAMFGNTLSTVFAGAGIPSQVYCTVLLVVLILANLNGIDMFAKIQDFVAYALVASLLIMGLIGCFEWGNGQVVHQSTVISGNPKDIFSLCGLAFFLFLGCEYVVPISKQVKNARRNVPLGMVLSLLLVFLMQAVMVIGFSHYTPWEALAQSSTPHVLYGSLLLGKAGTIWMVLVSVLAVTSTVNTAIASLGLIMSGMAKIKLLPSVFMKTNKKGAPYVGILSIGGIMILINLTGLSTTDELSFLILTGCVFWMMAYIISHLNVLILRRRLPKAPRTFRVPLSPVLPMIGIVGTVWMLYNIDSNLDVKLRIYKLSIGIFLLLAVYGAIWIKKVMKRPLFKPFQIKEVMAMEHELYQKYHK